jgi:anti-sigma factor RsiW
MSDHVSSEQLSLLVDGRLSLAAREAVIAHIRRCPSCAARHDGLIELTASLRLQGPLDWTQAHSETTLHRLRASDRPPSVELAARRPRRRRDLSLPLACLLALAGGFALVGVGPRLSIPAAGVLALLPGGPLLSGRLLVALAATVLVGLLALPLSRSR